MTKLFKKSVAQKNSYENTVLLVAMRFLFWLKGIARLRFHVNRAEDRDFGSG